MESTYRIPIDFGEGGLPKAVFAKQYDVGSRIIELEPYMRGEKMDIESDIIPYIQLTKPDGKTVVSECTVENGIIRAVLSPAALAVSGVVRAEIALYRKNTVISSHIFHIRVEAAAYSEETCTSSEEYNIFLKAINDAEKALRNAEIAAENAETAYAEIQEHLSVCDEKLKLKQDLLTFDEAPADGSKNPVTSSGILNAIKKSSLTPVSKTAEMTAEVGADENGKLWFDPLFAIPFAFESFTISPNGLREKGSEIRDFSLNFKTNKTPDSVITVSTWQAIDGKDCTPLVGTSGFLTLGTVGNAPPLISDSGSSYLKAVKNGEEYISPTLSITFANRIFMGTASGEAVSDAMINGLSVNKLASSRALTSSVTAGTGEYIYYACPVSYGVPTFKVGGFEGGFELIDGSFSYTNPSGYTEAYQIWRSVNANLGTITVEVT